MEHFKRPPFAHIVQEHRNPVFGMKNPHHSASFHGLPIGRSGLSGRAPLASGEGDAAFDNLAFENDALDSPRDIRRRHSPPSSQRPVRGRSLTLQDGSGASVYQHQQMTAPRPGECVKRIHFSLVISRLLYYHVIPLSPFSKMRMA